MAGAQGFIVLSYGHFQLKFVPDITTMDILLLLYFFFMQRRISFPPIFLEKSQHLIGTSIGIDNYWCYFITEHLAGRMTWKVAVLGSRSGAILFGASALKTKGFALFFDLHSPWNFGQWACGFKNMAGRWEAVIDRC